MNGGFSTQHAEKRLIDAARLGERPAFDELIEPYVPDVRKYIAARVESSEVDDIVQDVLVATWKALPVFDGRSRFRTWVFGICVHKIKDHYRSRLRKSYEVSLDARGVEPLVEGGQLKTDMVESVKSMMSCLSPSQAEVIELYYQQNLTLAEVASILDRNLNTVKYQFCQGHSRLHKAMEEGGLL
jgi:RNA polymerase sigma-70 factor (ECF subfamily)